MASAHSLEIDSAAGAAYLQLSDDPVASTVEVTPVINVDLDEFGVAVGIEVLDLGAEVPSDEIKKRCHVKSKDQQALEALSRTVTGRRNRRFVVQSQGSLIQSEEKKLSVAE